MHYISVTAYGCRVELSGLSYEAQHRQNGLKPDISRVAALRRPPPVPPPQAASRIG